MKFAFVHKIKLIFQEPFCGFFNKVFLSCSRKSFFVLKFSDGSLFLSLSETEIFLAEPTPYFRFIRYIRFFNWSKTVETDACISLMNFKYRDSSAWMTFSIFELPDFHVMGPESSYVFCSSEKLPQTVLWRTIDNYKTY